MSHTRRHFLLSSNHCHTFFSVSFPSFVFINVIKGRKITSWILFSFLPVLYDCIVPLNRKSAVQAYSKLSTNHTNPFPNTFSKLSLVRQSKPPPEVDLDAAFI